MPGPLDDDAEERRGAYARPVLDLFARFEPEKASAIGVPGAAERISRLGPDAAERRIVAYKDARRTLARQRAGEKHPVLRLDLEAMIEAVGWEIDVVRLEAALMLPSFSPAQICFEGIRSLLGGPAESDPGPLALRRLRLYAGLEAGAPPLAEQAEAAVRARLDVPGLRGPYRVAVEADLANTERLVAGIRRLLEKHRVPRHRAACRALERQLAAHGSFVRREILPRCRDEFRLPEELYAARLRACGVEMAQAELASRARVALREIRRQLEGQARRLARERGWRSEGFADVLRRLTRVRHRGEELLAHYRGRLSDLEELIASSGLVTLPQWRIRIRLASEAESVSAPFPHFRWPRLFDDRRDLGELILPAVAGSAGRGLDDGASPAGSWITVAHEALPGHALHLSHLLDQGAAVGRSIIAWNAACREGWAVYAESEVEPYLPPEARLIAAHRHLRRAAAAFLDPVLQQGGLSRHTAREILRTQVGLSAALAEREVWRYTVWRPGQATAYFCGYCQLADQRAEAECRLGSAFDRRRYHDFLLAQGILPLSLLRRRLLEESGPRRRIAA